MPPGLAAAVDDSTIELAIKFSKFLTGAAAFNAVSTLPYWAAHPAFYSFFELDRRFLTISSTNTNGTPEGDYSLMDSSKGSFSAIFSKGVSIAPKFPARIEPKTYFANERTFIQWVSASILLLSSSGFLLRADHDYKTTAAAISLSALCLVGYSTNLYFVRLNLLKDREPYGYFNKVNPIFLASVVGLAIFLIWADSVAGDDILDLFSSSGREEDDRRLLRSQFSGTILYQDYDKFPRKYVDSVVTKPSANRNISSFVVDSKRHSFLMISNEHVYFQTMNDNARVPVSADPLIKINQSHLRGLAFVDDRLFAVSGGPARTELIEMPWWRIRNDKNKLQVVERWTLRESRSQIDGFTFAPSSESTPTGSFYINMNSSIRVYSVPAKRKNEEQGQLSHPRLLRSLNMKALTQGLGKEGQEIDDLVSTMITFEGITYMLRPNSIALETWNMTDGTHFPEIKLPMTEAHGDMLKWTGFALERKITSDDTTSNGYIVDALTSDVLFLHLLGEVTGGGEIWSFPVIEKGETPLFSVPDISLQ